MDQVWTKSEKYVPALCPDTLRLIISMAVEQCHTLKQGDCKNTFCQGILSPDKITIVKLPIGDPDAKKNEYYWLLKQTLYGLCCSPKHWHDKICKIFHKIGLHQNAYDSCLLISSILWTL